MIGPFCYHDITNNEDYKKYLQKRNKLYYCLLLTGILTLLLAFIAEKQFNDMTVGFLTGAGTGLTIGAIVIIYKTKQLLNDETKLKKDRIIKSDERNKMICNQSTKVSLLALLIIIYILIIIGILYDQIILRSMITLLFSFIIIYNLAYKYYSHKL